MMAWTSIKNEKSMWEIFANGKYVTTADNDEEARMLLECIEAYETSGIL